MPRCSHGSEPCSSGQRTFWFSQGCTIGCAKCDGNGTRLTNFDHCPGTSIKPTLLDKYRTANTKRAAAGSVADMYKFNPWRAPGGAPTFDPCGMASGSAVGGSQGGEYDTTKYAKQGDRGSVVLKPRPSGTVWKRGAVARVRQQLTAPHGGGYIFRLCPASESLTEACLNKLPLEFARPSLHTVVLGNGSRDNVPATLVAEGGGKGRMIHPYQAGTSGDMDYVVHSAGHHCYYKNGTRDAGLHKPPIHSVPYQFACKGCAAPLYAAYKACPCPNEAGRRSAPATRTCPLETAPAPTRSACPTPRPAWAPPSTPSRTRCGFRRESRPGSTCWRTGGIARRLRRSGSRAATSR